METLDDWYRKSRGKVKCSLCGTTISKGVEYYVSKNVYDGCIYEWKECPDCSAIARYFYERNWEYLDDCGYTADDVDEMCLDAFADGVDPALRIREAQVMWAYLKRRGLEDHT